VITYGNAIDLNECDYLDYFSQDPETKIILMYIEGLRDSKRFFKSLKQAASTKPIIILKGGRGESGMRAAASHTAALAGSTKIWETMTTQAGAISARDFDEMADLAVSFYFLPPVHGPRVGVVGGGGGPSVLSADICEEAGLDVIPLPTEIREELRRQGNSIWDWIGNPTDSSISGETAFSAGDMLQMMDRNQNFDILIGIMGEGTPAGKEAILARRRGDVKSYVKVKKKISKPLLVMVEEKSLGTKDYNNWRWRVMSEARAKLIASGIPTYPTMARTASTARKLVEYYQRRK
jgi:acyl-CoA synthetase (NDP forming)